MPPKVKVTKEEIINAAVDIVRKNGVDAINARNIAAVLNCSTQPIFSNFATMDDLRIAVIEKVDKICAEFIRNEIKESTFVAYKASGRAYIKFAKEEKELFKLLYMRDRTNENFAKGSDMDGEMEHMVQGNTGLSLEEARLFHLEMWAYVHGIAVMFATAFIELDDDLVSKMMTDAYQGLRKQYGLE